MSQRRRRTNERVTLSDVARAAGCSLMSVSRALSQPDRVSPALREQVMQAVKALGYVPHTAARTLASARSNLVAVIIPSLSNVVFVDTVEAIQHVLMSAGFDIMIGVSHYRAEEDERLLRAYLAHQPAGLILTGFDRSDAVHAILDGYHGPVVTLMDLSEVEENYCVGFSQLAAGAAMTKALLEQGYRNIALAAAQLDPRTLQRVEGYRQAMREAHCYNPDLELLTPYLSSVGLGAELLDQLLAREQPFDAVFFNNDDLALGALFRAQQRGIAVPEQLGIAGFNDLPAAAWAHPSLTTVRTTRGEIGRQAADMLLTLMRGEKPAKHCIDVGFEVILRKSS
ncbi:LacI family transcriptional regulator [Pseudomonas duriflava]|uniref:LacI family transcriptional regulator n=1 Tax=Pseudomonas duriflava TaxID=459528 RepID=A0A562QE72_9PSED|nr:LacI family DNA-binding transcriptional regulator [Pseudomonas duriflava]TWI55034.1 LacI family transcriptional regulator [Pseudomonas duriflava]